MVNLPVSNGNTYPSPLAQRSPPQHVSDSILQDHRKFAILPVSLRDTSPRDCRKPAQDEDCTNKTDETSAPNDSPGSQNSSSTPKSSGRFLGAPLTLRGPRHCSSASSLLNRERNSQFFEDSPFTSTPNSGLLENRKHPAAFDSTRSDGLDRPRTPISQSTLSACLPVQVFPQTPESPLAHQKPRKSVSMNFGRSNSFDQPLSSEDELDCERAVRYAEEAIDGRSVAVGSTRYLMVSWVLFCRIEATLRWLCQQITGVDSSLDPYELRRRIAVSNPFLCSGLTYE